MCLCAVAGAGQTLAQTTSCLDILLDLFRYFAMLIVCNSQTQCCYRDMQSPLIKKNNTHVKIYIYFCRTTSPLSTEAISRAANGTLTYQLWMSVCSALCGCVNNPQNGNYANELTHCFVLLQYSHSSLLYMLSLSLANKYFGMAVSKNE